MKQAKWIWHNTDNNADEHVKFYDEFECGKNSGGINVSISCDSDYALYINGKLAAFGQYPDYPHYKIFDTVDISAYIVTGKNKIVVLAWYYGADFQTYFKGNAGLIFEISQGEKVLCSSGQGTFCKLAEDYICYNKKIITAQLGFSYRYDARKYDGYDGARFEPSGFCRAVLTKQVCNLFPRPIKKLALNGTSYARPAGNNIYDLGEEKTGFLHVKFKAAAGTVLNISFGEHLADNAVRRKIGDRDFSVELVANGGWFEFSDTFRRLGCRYLQVGAGGGEDFEIDFIGLKELKYPVTKKAVSITNPLRQKIYDTSVRTLELCMHEHYEDTPWREQALYNLDSRNQMLFGYYAFEGGNYDFARANLKLISEDKRPDGLQNICFPSSCDLTIPAFSLYYIIQMQEYAEHSGDNSLLREYAGKLKQVIDIFCGRLENGLISTFYGSKNHWNFYEWSEGLEGRLWEAEEKQFDSVLNSLFLYALQSYIIILDKHLKIPVNPEYYSLVKTIKRGVNEAFYNAENGLYRTRKDGENYSELTNALAVLSGAADTKEKAERICRQLAGENGMTKATLSMLTFKYDALLLNARYQNDKTKYNDYILRDIEKIYGYMLDSGATSFWETIKGESDFDGAGSLCHGWSAIPAYYYHILSVVKLF